jgi:hypothetical protein
MSPEARRTRDGRPESGTIWSDSFFDRALGRSEGAVEGLVRLVGRQSLPRCAGSFSASNVAFRGITPDLATAIQAVTKSGVEAGRIGAVTHTTDLLLGCCAPRTAAAGDRYAPTVSEQRDASHVFCHAQTAVRPIVRSRGVAKASRARALGRTPALACRRSGAGIA